MAVSRVTYAADGWGVGELWFDGPRLVWHELPAPTRAATSGAAASGPAGAADRTASPPTGGAKAPSVTVSGIRAPVRDGTATKASKIADAVARRAVRHLAGERVAWDDVELELDWCTPFQRALADALRAVPWGETVTYAELAALAGRPSAPRAAGTFCAHNRFPLLLPCHRVVAAGGIGGYGSSGVEYKRRLLAVEGRADL